MKRFSKLWGMPILLAALSLCGLIYALIREGVGDVIACLFLLVPVFVVIRFYYFPKDRNINNGISE
ncbi:MAG: hypothetical protein QM640_11260 [Niabella sp.]